MLTRATAAELRGFKFESSGCQSKYEYCIKKGHIEKYGNNEKIAKLLKISTRAVRELLRRAKKYVFVDGWEVSRMLIEN